MINDHLNNSIQRLWRSGAGGGGGRAWAATVSPHDAAREGAARACAAAMFKSTHMHAPFEFRQARQVLLQLAGIAALPAD
jgi:hypothetical protein